MSKRKITFKLLSVALVPFLVWPLFGAVAFVVVFAATVFEVARRWSPAAVVSDGQLRVLSGGQIFGVTSHESYALAEIRSAKFWPEYITLEMNNEQTFSIWLAPFTSSARSAFCRDLEVYLQDHRWPSPPPAT